MHRRIIVIGGVAGGASAAARARRLSEEAEIIVVERGPYASFANCGLPYFVGGEISDWHGLLVQSPEVLKARMNLDIRVRTEAIEIDRQGRTVTLKDLDTDRVYTEAYDALILAPGSTPLRPPIPGIERPGHFVLRNIPNARDLDAYLADRSGGRAVIVGGGYIGLEMAEQLVRRGHPVALIEALPHVAGFLDADMACRVHAELRQHGVDLHLGKAVRSFDDPDASDGAMASVAVLEDGSRIPGDVVLLAMGVRPETTLAKAAGLTIGITGGIKVDEQMQTSDPHIWAVGDAVEVIHGVTGRPMLLPLAGPANRQGRIAADSIMGRASAYRGSFGTGILRIFNLAAAGTGANARMLDQAGLSYQAIHVHPMDHASYYPGASPLAMKLLYDPGNGRLLGAQVVGLSGVDKRIDVLATAIQSGLTVDQIADLELAYAPPFGSAKDPVNIAGMAAGNVLRGDVHVAHCSDIGSCDTETTCLLDVREEAECVSGVIPSAMTIPLSQLRARLDELPRDREIIVYCRSGQRSYYACRILHQHGYTVRNLSGAYLSWSAAAG